jgi:hypothetical protein
MMVPEVSRRDALSWLYWHEQSARYQQIRDWSARLSETSDALPDTAVSHGRPARFGTGRHGVGKASLPVELDS